jgi:hypothetical protein
MKTKAQRLIDGLVAEGYRVRVVETEDGEELGRACRFRPHTLLVRSLAILTLHRTLDTLALSRAMAKEAKARP